MGKESWAPKEEVVGPVLGKVVESSQPVGLKAEVLMGQAGGFSIQGSDL